MVVENGILMELEKRAKIRGKIEHELGLGPFVLQEATQSIVLRVRLVVEVQDVLGFRELFLQLAAQNVFLCEYQEGEVFFPSLDPFNEEGEDVVWLVDHQFLSHGIEDVVQSMLLGIGDHFLENLVFLLLLHYN